MQGMGEEGVYGNSVYFLCTFAIKLKLMLQKLKSINFFKSPLTSSLKRSHSEKLGVLGHKKWWGGEKGDGRACITWAYNFWKASSL